MFSQQIFPWKALRHCEALRSFADQHHVTGVLHHGFGDQRNVLDVANPAHRARPASWSMHAAGIEFDDALFIRQTAQTYAVIVCIVLWAFYHPQRCIQRVAAGLQELKACIQIWVAIVGANDDWALACRLLRRQVDGQRSNHCRTDELTAGKAHLLPSQRTGRITRNSASRSRAPVLHLYDAREVLPPAL